MRFTSPIISQYKKLKYWDSIFFLNKYTFSFSSIKDSILLSYIYGMFNIDKSKNKFNFFLKNGIILAFTRLLKLYKTFIWFIYFNKITPLFANNKPFNRRRKYKNKFRRKFRQKFKKHLCFLNKTKIYGSKLIFKFNLFKKILFLKNSNSFSKTSDFFFSKKLYYRFLSFFFLKKTNISYLKKNHFSKNKFALKHKLTRIRRKNTRILLSFISSKPYNVPNLIKWRTWARRLLIISNYCVWYIINWYNLLINNKNSNKKRLFSIFFKIKRLLTSLSFIKKKQIKIIIKKPFRQSSKKTTKKHVYINNSGILPLFKNCFKSFKKIKSVLFLKKTLLLFPFLAFLKLFLVKIVKIIYNTALNIQVHFLYLKNFVVRSFALCHFVSGKLKRQYRIQSIYHSLRSLLNKLFRIDLIKGFKFSIFGRFTRNDRAAFFVQNLNLPANTKFKKIDFFHKLLRLRFGICSIRIWLWK